MLTYHLLDADGRLLQHDNVRTPLRDRIPPRAPVAGLKMNVHAPSKPGWYKLEVDLVWEGVTWFKARGNPTAFIDLEVIPIPSQSAQAR
jgi:hypothetical protein